MTSRSQAFLAAVASANSWADIHTAWASKTEKEKGDRFEDLIKAYLQLAPEYASKLKHVWHLDEVPAVTRKKLNLPATDKGIDLIAETHEGEFWAVQCKYRQNTNQQLTHTDISTFTSLTFQACKGISYALVCSTTERVTQLYRGEERIGFCALDTWQELDQDFFARLRASLSSKPVDLEARKPRPHQQNAVKDGLEHFAKRKEARGKLIMPCGTGKSLTAWFLVQSLGSQRIVIAVPSLSLVKQTLKVWLRESVAKNLNVNWICVCSDETAGKADQDDVVVQRQDIAVPCLTSTDKIAEWLKVKRKGLTVVFTTYQSGDVLATATRKAKFTFDLGIMDEAHKTVGDGDKQFSILLHDHNIEISQRVFMTATERRYKGSSDKVLSMDDPGIYGDTFHQLSFKQAMECQPPILCDYNVITIGVSREEIKDLIKKNVFVRPTGGKWDEEMEADMLAAMIALRKAMKEHPIKHAVSFHGSIQRAELFKAHNDTFTREFPEFGSLDTFHVSGQTPTGTRSNIIKTFAQADRSLVTNARCLTEGVDVPGIDCVLFADPRKSTVDIVQAVGRALRPSEGKKLGYVILPVLHETDATSEQVIDSGAFKEILSTISALAANDDRIIEYFRGISQGRIPSGQSRISFEWNERLSQNIDVNKLVNELQIKCWGRLAKLTWRQFEEARAFVRNLGLKSQKQWADYCKGKITRLGKRPLDIPTTPSNIYQNSGWVDLADWIGHISHTSKFSKSNPARDFESARAFARSLGLKGQKEWSEYCAGKLACLPEIPKDIPTNPQKTYGNKGWISIGDWLGTGFVSSKEKSKRWRSFSEAKKFARSLGMSSFSEWSAFCKKGQRPIDIPRNPQQVYDEWQGWGDWLGTGTLAPGEKVFMPFVEAREYVRSLGLKSSTQWRDYCNIGIPGIPKKPDNIPAGPGHFYKDKGWKGMGDWLGTGTTAPGSQTYLPFEEARKFARSLDLKNQGQWYKYCKTGIQGKPTKPKNIPTTPDRIYKELGWVSMGDWLGTGFIASTKRKLRAFTEAREFARGLKLKSASEWKSFCNQGNDGINRLPDDIPKAPQIVYKDEWKDFADWLGYETRKPEPMNFQMARDYIRGLGLNSTTEWDKYCRGKLRHLPEKPASIPTNPHRTYKDLGWVDYGDWLGSSRKATRAIRFLDFVVARNQVRMIGLKNTNEWKRLCKGEHGSLKLPKDIPTNPHRTYKGRGWISYFDWLGIT